FGAAAAITFRNSVCASESSKMKYCLRQLALGVAVPCRAEVRCPKRISVTQELLYFLAQALRSKKNKLNRRFYLETKGWFFIGGSSPAVCCSPHSSGLPLPSGLGT
ncbi:hypothetical protein, partial [Pedobacter suwonensis]|uniref:hypothetical protein n=1 Tax=Pedobacter suwonensis TaxID=332999 RepID=UPI003800CEC0